MKKIILFFFVCSLTTLLQAQTIPSNGLIGYWPFSGNTNDVSGNNNHGTNVGATLTKDHFMLPGMAYSFNGTSYIEIAPSTSLNITNLNKLSISLWAYPTNNNNYERFISFANVSGGDVIDLMIDQKKIWFANVTSGDYIYCWSTDTIPVNKWTHIVAMIDFINKTGYLYVNGIKNSQYTAINVMKPNNPTIQIGKFVPATTTPPGAFYGSLDEVRIYDRVLDTTEIQSLFVDFPDTGYYYKKGMTAGLAACQTKSTLLSESISVFPNPTLGVITISGESVFKTDVFDINGILLETCYNKQIDLSNYPAGNYILKIFSIDKMIKQEEIIVVK